MVESGVEYKVGAFLRKIHFSGPNKVGKILRELSFNECARISQRIVSKIQEANLKQASDNLDELYAAAEVAKRELKEITVKFADETSGKPGLRPKEINGGLKSRERALEKITGDYDGIASKLVDIAGSKVVYNSIEELYTALEKFNKEFKILKIKDRIQKPLISGYRDILMNIQMKNGHIVEFRLHLKAIDEVAVEGHKIYQQRRTLEAISAERKLTIQEKEMMESLLLKEKKIYGNAWSKIINNKK